MFECIDEKTKRIFFEVFETTTRFKDSNLARQFVASRSKIGDILALKAVRIVFRSKAGATTRTKK